MSRRRRVSGGGLGVGQDLMLWLDASDTSTITESSGSVSNWADKSSNGYNFPQSTGGLQPQTEVDTQNSLNVLTFNGSKELNWDAGFVDTFNGSSTMFVVSKRDVDSGSQGLMSSENNKLVLFYAAPAGEIDFRSNNAVAASVTATSVTTTNYNVIRSRRSGTTQAVAVNGGAEFTNTNGSDITGVTDGLIGATDGGSNKLTGKIAEIIVYGRSLTATEITNVENYLSNKWGI